MIYPPNPRRRPLRRQCGVMLAWSAVSIIVVTAMAALTIDMGMMYWRKAEAKKAADAAALAGAWQFTISGNTITQATQVATTYASYNGYNLDPANPPHLLSTDDTKFQVAVKRTEAKCFLGVFNPNAWYSSAVATAQYKIPVDAPIQGSMYGMGNTPYSYSLFGPLGLHSNGDTYSVLYTNSGAVNPDYNPNGYPFTLNIPSNYVARNSITLPGQTQVNPTPSLVQVEIFDPTTTTSSAYDEIRAPNPGQATGYDEDTTTKYTLEYKSISNASDTWHTISSTSFHTEAQAADKWVTPSGFQFDINNYPGDQFQVVVQSTAGSSENGFSLRAGPPNPTTGTVYTNQAGTNYTVSSLPDTGSSSWNALWSGFNGTNTQVTGGINGTTIAAHGLIPLNVNATGTLDILLGNVPQQAAGGEFHVNRFDTDVGATELYYWNDWQGQSVKYNDMKSTDSPPRLGPSTNDESFTDLVSLPTNYPGANWHAAYTAGASDTSSWSIGWEQVNLVGGAGLTY